MLRRLLTFLFFFITLSAPLTAMATPLCFCYFGESNDCVPTTVPDTANASDCQQACDKKYLLETHPSVFSPTTFSSSEEEAACTAAHSIANPVVTKELEKGVLPELAVKIPGVVFTPVLNKGGVLEINFLAEYIAGVYIYILGFSILVAVVFLIIGGFQYSLGAISKDQITKAKKRIIDALIGLVLLLSVMLILQTTNPQIATLNPIRILSIDRVDQAAVEHATSVEDDSYDSSEPYVPVSGKNIALPFSAGSRAKYPLVQRPLKPGDSYIDPPRPCSVPIPSEAESLNGVVMNTQYLGLLDCNISGRTKNKKRIPSDIKMIVLHQGFKSAGASSVKNMISMWFKDYHFGKHVTCKLNKKGVFNYPECKTAGPVLFQPTTKQTPIGSHFAVDSDGTIYQMADVLHSMNHCCDINKISVGIDIQYLTEGKKNVYTDAHYQAIANLIKGLSQKYGFPINDTTIRGHCELGTHADPPNFDLKKLGELMGVTLNPAVHQKGRQCSWL